MTRLWSGSQLRHVVGERINPKVRLREEIELTTSGAKGFRLSAPPTARGEVWRARASAA